MKREKYIQAAYRALEGVGNPRLGEWTEWSNHQAITFHVRRRLSAVEQAIVGDVVDVRGTPEGERRLEIVRREAPYIPEHYLQGEASKF